MSELLTLEALRVLPSDLMEVNDPAIYFLWSGDDLLYIGGTTQSCERIARHIRDRNYRNAINGMPIPFKRYTFLEVDGRDLWNLETEYLHRYEPPYNDLTWQRRRRY